MMDVVVSLKNYMIGVLVKMITTETSLNDKK